MDIKRIMLVDDEDDIRTIGQISLAEIGGWEVLLASSGAQALELARAEQPDLILLDVMMPGMDGPTTFQRLQSHPETAHIPIIFLTAKVQKHEQRRYLELGAAGVIPKPFDPITLPETIRRVVQP